MYNSSKFCPQICCDGYYRFMTVCIPNQKFGFTWVLFRSGRMQFCNENEAFEELFFQLFTSENHQFPARKEHFGKIEIKITVLTCSTMAQQP